MELEDTPETRVEDRWTDGLFVLLDSQDNSPREEFRATGMDVAIFQTMRKYAYDDDPTMAIAPGLMPDDEDDG